MIATKSQFPLILITNEDDKRLKGGYIRRYNDFYKLCRVVADKTNRMKIVLYTARCFASVNKLNRLKKIISIIILSFIAFGCKAQTVVSQTKASGNNIVYANSGKVENTGRIIIRNEKNKLGDQ